jgi:hypothetical protein
MILQYPHHTTQPQFQDLSVGKRILTANQPQHIFFPGGGVNFWWQAGTILALSETCDLKNGNFQMYGASAGSISSVLAACGVDLKFAMRIALSPSKGHTHADRIERWLQEILPENCHRLCSNKVNISVTTIHLSYLPLHRKVINVFSSKKDVIDCCLTSCHIPYLLDGNFSRVFRGEHCVDGSFLFFLHCTPWDRTELELNGKQKTLLLYHRNDKELLKHHWSIFHVLDAPSTVAMFNLGYEYGKRLLTQQQTYKSHV